MEIKDYISANTPAIAENCIIFLIWYGRPIYKSIQKNCDDADRYFSGIKKSLSGSVVACLEDITKNQSSFAKFLKDRMDRICRPRYTSIKEYIRAEFESDFTISEIIEEVRRDMIECGKFRIKKIRRQQK